MIPRTQKLSFLAGLIAATIFLLAGLLFPRPGSSPELLEIDSLPSGAEVLLGEKSLGHTPLKVARSEFGAAKSIELRLEGYQSVRVQADQNLLVRLAPQPATLQLVLEPKDLKLSLDGEEVKAEGSLTVEPGTHLLVAQADGYLPASARVDAKRGQTHQVKLKLKPILAIPPLPEVVLPTSPGTPPSRPSWQPRPSAPPRRLPPAPRATAAPRPSPAPRPAPRPIFTPAPAPPPAPAPAPIFTPVP